ncbi:MAG: GxxExxY protein [Chloroflexi bacterium]|nr:GxxExxY protein [Chloroflexota bacterium]
MELIYKDEVYAIIGAAMDVYNNLGPGFLEAVYQEAMEIETLARKIPALPEQRLYIQYKGAALKKFYEADLICYKKILVEIKAIDQLTSREESQILNYLKATGFPVGVLINFGAHKDLEWKRMVLTQDKHPRKYRQINELKKISED